MPAVSHLLDIVKEKVLQIGLPGEEIPIDVGHVLGVQYQSKSGNKILNVIFSLTNRLLVELFVINFLIFSNLAKLHKKEVKIFSFCVRVDDSFIFQTSSFSLNLFYKNTFTFY